MNARWWITIPLALLLSGCPQSPDKKPKANSGARRPKPAQVATSPIPPAVSDGGAQGAALGSSEYWIERLSHPDAEQRERAATALARKGSRGAPEIIAALENSNPVVRAAAAHVCELMGPASEEIVPALTKALRDDVANVRLHAARALGEMGLSAEPAAADLIHAMNDDDPAVVMEAEKALQKIQGG